MDGDQRNAKDVENLRKKRIACLDFYSVESLYFCEHAVRYAAYRLQADQGIDAENVLSQAFREALGMIRSQVDRLSALAAEKRIREALFNQLPTWKEILTNVAKSVAIDPQIYFHAERERLKALVDSENLLQIIAKYPVRETSALDSIAKKLGFQSLGRYTSFIQNRIKSDSVFRDELGVWLEPANAMIRT